jgi:hypothetical protein
MRPCACGGMSDDCQFCGGTGITPRGGFTKDARLPKFWHPGRPKSKNKSAAATLARKRSALGKLNAVATGSPSQRGKCPYCNLEIKVSRLYKHLLRHKQAGTSRL